MLKEFMTRDDLHKKLVENDKKIRDWYAAHTQDLNFPIYSSFDLRDAGFKMGPVDANIFPAGFNNICATDRENSVELAKMFLDSHYGKTTQKILLLTEEHTQNPYYWDNVLALQNILTGSGRELRLAIPRPLDAPLQVMSASGQTVTVYSAERKSAGIAIADFSPDLIISNNDFSSQYEDWALGLETPMNPPRELGWYRRRKDRFFKIYNSLSTEFSALLGVDPWTLTVETEVFSHFDVDSEDSRDQLAQQAQKVWDRIKLRYAEHGVAREPFLFVKNNAGTYGLGVIQVKHPEEIKAWNYKARKKMKAAKGGREVSEVIIQEGIPTTVLSSEGRTAEPVIYMIGCQLAGGFLRTHGEKGDDDSLNSPGAVFQKLCIADLDVRLAGCPMENAYGAVARLSFLAVAQEARELGVEFRNYTTKGPCSQ